MVVEDLAAASPVPVEWSFLVKAADGRATAVRVLVLPEGNNVAITPAAATVAPGATLQLSSTPPGLGWRVTGPPGATISPNGLFTAPASPGTWGVFASSPDGAIRGATTVVVR